VRRRVLPLVLGITCLLAPIGAPARAAGDDGTPGSKLGVLLMIACGLSLKASIIAPVPWAGVAAMSCMFGLLDAALTEDTPSHSRP